MGSAVAAKQNKCYQEHEHRAERVRNDELGALPSRLPTLDRLQVLMPTSQLNCFRVIQVRFHGGVRCVTAMRLTLHGMQDDFLDFFRDLAIELPRRDRIAHNPGVHDDEWIIAFEWD